MKFLKVVFGILLALCIIALGVVLVAFVFSAINSITLPEQLNLWWTAVSQFFTGLTGPTVG